MTRVLAKSGAKVIMACRDPDKAQVVADSIDGDIEVRRLDMADLDGDVDVLINNAGVVAVPNGTTADGFERHIGTNHLGPFALTGLLIDRVRVRDRVPTVSSGLLLLGRIRGDLNWERRRYQRWLAYAQSNWRTCSSPTSCNDGCPQRAGDHLGGGSPRRRSDRGAVPGHLASGQAPCRRAGASPRDGRAADSVRGDRAWRRRRHLGRAGRVHAAPRLPTLVRTSLTSRDIALAAQLWQRFELITGVRYAIEPL